MKTLNPRNLINKATGVASKISVSITNMIAAAVREVMSPVFPVEQPQRVRVAVRVEHNPLPYRRTH